MVKPMSAERVAKEVAALSKLPGDGLVELWEQRLRCAPPKCCGRWLLELAAGYSIQKKAFGGLKAATRGRWIENRFQTVQSLISHTVAETQDRLMHAFR